MEFENVFYFKKINSIGGVESFLYYLSCLYKNFVFIYREGDPVQIQRLSKNIEVIKYNEQKIKCKRIFFNYGPDIIDNVDAEEYIFMVHCDYTQVSFLPATHPKITKYISVSKLAKEKLEERCGLKSEVIYNPVIVKKTNTPKLTDKIHLVSATRLTKEKGGERINQLCKILENNNIDYTWDIYSNRRYRFVGKNINIKEPKLDLAKEFEEATYVVQLSDHESFGLTVAESLCLGTPVIVTDIPAFKEVGCKHGENAVICDLAMKKVDVDLIKKGIPKFNYKPPKSNWGRYLDNNSSYNPKDKIEIRVTRRFFGVKENKHFEFGKTYFLTKERVSELECKGLVQRI